MIPQSFVLVDGHSSSSVRDLWRRDSENKLYIVIDRSMSESPIDIGTNHIRLLKGWDFDTLKTEILELLQDPFLAMRMRKVEFVSSRDHRLLRALWDECCDEIRLQWGEANDSLLGLETTLKNLPLIEECPGVLALKNAFRSVPAVVVGTGPSLPKSLDALRDIQRKALIIAADSALTILLQNGVTPHFFCSLERAGLQSAFYDKTVIPTDPKTEMIVFPLVPKWAIQAYRGKKWIAYRDYGYFADLEKQVPKGIIPSFASVSHFGVRIAEFLGCESVVLVGQDLSFDPGTFVSHSQGIVEKKWAEPQSRESLEEKLRQSENGSLRWVKGNLVREVPTGPLYYRYLLQLSVEARRLRVPLWNATEGGAEIPGVPWKRLNDFTSTWCETSNLFDRIQKARQSFQKISFNRSRFQNILDCLEKQWSQILCKLETDTGNHRRHIDVFYQHPVVLRYLLQNSGKQLLDLENQWISTLDREWLREWKLQLNDLFDRVKNTLIAAARD